MRLITLALTLSLLTACSIFPEPAPPSVDHDLTPAAGEARPDPDGPVVTVTADAAPAAAGRDLLRREDTALVPLTGHRWVEPPARLLADTVARRLEERGAVRAALVGTTGARPGRHLELRLLALEQAGPGEPVTLALTARLLTADGTLLDSRRLRLTEAVDGPGGRAHAAAARGAVDRAANQLAEMVDSLE
ncbi:ABC-type transport auxiliary lipoprotein component [Thiohalospira halophila DSM 15071]|uniref:ABC-type transport auxiliary lipoprotein component n=1 Tax=Thiohalospira halophila DSM 15071 TaxID=1123397 RepID=A0A1I1QJ87_9GAMM|nr:ABC-type transport auxiliary lipoprotein family protein [Thiohalospira halophila]SFD22119.1 ABC-type transport auxiliary lipoprotein component [Thiohalospira halophila DSM 15071]